MILIVNTTTNTTVTDDLKKSLAGNAKNVEIIEAGSLKINPCIGCNDCWLKTPGECTIKDDFEMILKRSYTRTSCGSFRTRRSDSSITKGRTSMTGCFRS